MLDEPEKVKNMDKSDAEIAFYDSLQTSRAFLKERVKDSQVIQTYVHDRTVIQSFVEVNEFADGKNEMSNEHDLDMEGIDEIKPEGTHEIHGEGEHETVKEGTRLSSNLHHEPELFYQAIHLIRRQDMSVTKVTSDGEICIVSGPTRASLNKHGHLMKMGKDFDYLLELFDVRAQERKGGIFTCSLDKHHIITHDRDRNYFAVNSNGTFEKVLAPELSEVDPAEEHQEHDMEEHIEFHEEEKEMFNEETRSRGKTVVPKVNMTKSKSSFANVLPVAPRIFKINIDGSASEYFTKDKMTEETSKFTSETIIVKSAEFLGQNPVQMHSYFKELKQSELIDEEFSVVAEIQSRKLEDCKLPDEFAIPKNVEEYLLIFRPIIEQPKSKIYLYRNYIQHKDFDHFKSSAFFDDMERYKKWKSDADAAVFKKFGVFEKDQPLGNRENDKRIMIKIYRERQKKIEDFGYQKIRDMRIQAITSKLRNVSIEQKDAHIKVEEQSSGRDQAHDIVDDNDADYNMEAEGEGSPGKAPEPASLMDIENPRKKRTQIVMEEITELKKEPYFVPFYFDSHFGREFLIENPPKAPNEEVLMRMSQRMSRSIGATEGGHASSNEEDRLSKYSQKDMDQDKHPGEIGSQYEEMHDNAIVALEPEDDENQDLMRMSGMKKSQMRSKLGESIEEPGYFPSMYLQEKEYLKQKDEEALLKAEEYHVSKTKEFNVYGKLRPLKLKVKSIAKSKIKPEMNEKFITTESITDKRIKIASMANRAYLHAPNVNQVRKQGQHQMILQAITKKQTFNELISQANAMVTSVLNDPLKRSVNILPSQANFGSIKEGSKYEVLITCKNEDMLPQRIVIRQGKDPRISIQQDNGGPIASGMVKNIRVVIDTKKKSESSVISDKFEIVTKTDIYKIPITATVLSEDRFDEINAESFKIHNRSAMRSTVREISDAPKTKVKEMLKKYEEHGWVETTGSESKLPSLPNIRNRAFEPDAQRELDEVIEQQSRMSSRRDSRASRMSKRSRQSNRE